MQKILESMQTNNLKKSVGKGGGLLICYFLIWHSIIGHSIFQGKRYSIPVCGICLKEKKAILTTLMQVLDQLTSNSEYLVRNPVQAALQSNKTEGQSFFLNTFA